MSKDCVFCQIVSGGLPASIVHADAQTLAFVDLRQFRPGHGLIIPRLHLRDVRDLDGPTGDPMATVSLITRAVGQALPNRGLSLWHSVGLAAFQEVPHLHFHVHTRRTDDDCLRVYPGEPSVVDQPTRDHYAALVRAQLEILSP